MEREGSLPCSQKPASGPYTEPAPSTPPWWQRVHLIWKDPVVSLKEK